MPSPYLRKMAEGGTVDNDLDLSNPTDAQILARRILAKHGYKLDGSQTAGLPPKADYPKGLEGLDTNSSLERKVGLGDMQGRARMAAEESSYIPSKYKKRMAEGGVVEPEKPSLFSRLGDFLFGNKALKQAANTGTPPPLPQQPQQDISYVKKAAQEAAERMRKAKETGAKEFKKGGVVKPGSYGLH